MEGGKARLYRTEALVLRQVRLGEADKILTLCTPHLGKLRVVARGVCRPKSKLAGHLEPLSHTMLMLARGQTLDVITQAQSIESFAALRQDLWLVSCALYVAELTDRFGEEHLENYPLFCLSMSALRCLCQAKEPSLVLRSFEVQLLGLSGYRPQLEKCSLCASPVGPGASFFSAGSGGMVCPVCRQKDISARRLSAGALKVLRLLQQRDFSVTSRLKLDEELALEVEQALRYYIRYYAEQDVKSPRWLDTLRREEVRSER